jgi:RNA polymerase sigma-70 factor, ECF subfamily
LETLNRNDRQRPSSAQLDESAVAAVRGGDAERYRELVERHERRVFAVAWSRLGDAALAEEATQEAFIRAYRRLWLLGDGAKFSGWVNTIARRVAINFGLRHRRELNKRERWALENVQRPRRENSAAETDPLHTPETLRQTLAELPAAHRECLVLFYLEGKSGAEAAAALGISESALRVRLHRARAAMRERLEEKLEGSLANCVRPKRWFPPSWPPCWLPPPPKLLRQAALALRLPGRCPNLVFSKGSRVLPSILSCCLHLS